MVWGTLLGWTGGAIFYGVVAPVLLCILIGSFMEWWNESQFRKRWLQIKATLLRQNTTEMDRQETKSLTWRTMFGAVKQSSPANNNKQTSDRFRRGSNSSQESDSTRNVHAAPKLRRSDSGSAMLEQQRVLEATLGDFQPSLGSTKPKVLQLRRSRTALPRTKSAITTGPSSTCGPSSSVVANVKNLWGEIGPMLQEENPSLHNDSSCDGYDCDLDDTQDEDERTSSRYDRRNSSDSHMLLRRDSSSSTPSKSVFIPGLVALVTVLWIFVGGSVLAHMASMRCMDYSQAVGLLPSTSESAIGVPSFHQCAKFAKSIKPLSEASSPRGPWCYFHNTYPLVAIPTSRIVELASCLFLKPAGDRAVSLVGGTFGDGTTTLQGNAAAPRDGVASSNGNVASHNSASAREESLPVVGESFLQADRPPTGYQVVNRFVDGGESRTAPQEWELVVLVVVVVGHVVARRQRAKAMERTFQAQREELARLARRRTPDTDPNKWLRDRMAERMLVELATEDGSFKVEIPSRIIDLDRLENQALPTPSKEILRDIEQFENDASEDSSSNSDTSPLPSPRHDGTFNAKDQVEYVSSSDGESLQYPADPSENSTPTCSPGSQGLPAPLDELFSADAPKTPPRVPFPTINYVSPLAQTQSDPSIHLDDGGPIPPVQHPSRRNSSAPMVFQSEIRKVPKFNDHQNAQRASADQQTKQRFPDADSEDPLNSPNSGHALSPVSLIPHNRSLRAMSNSSTSDEYSEHSDVVPNAVGQEICHSPVSPSHSAYSTFSEPSLFSTFSSHQSMEERRQQEEMKRRQRIEDACFRAMADLPEKPGNADVEEVMEDMKQTMMRVVERLHRKRHGRISATPGKRMVPG